MVKLDENNLMSFENHSSKGNQLKWKLGDDWQIITLERLYVTALMRRWMK